MGSCFLVVFIVLWPIVVVILPPLIVIVPSIFSPMANPLTSTPLEKSLADSLLSKHDFTAIWIPLRSVFDYLNFTGYWYSVRLMCTAHSPFQPFEPDFLVMQTSGPSSRTAMVLVVRLTVLKSSSFLLTNWIFGPSYLFGMRWNFRAVAYKTKSATSVG